MTAVRRLDRHCPGCGAPPRLRTVPFAQQVLREIEPGKVILTYQCHRCGLVYPIRAGDFIGR